jgi:hypothetical protein
MSTVDLNTGGVRWAMNRLLSRRAARVSLQVFPISLLNAPLL